MNTKPAQSNPASMPPRQPLTTAGSANTAHAYTKNGLFHGSVATTTMAAIATSTPRIHGCLTAMRNTGCTNIKSMMVPNINATHRLHQSMGRCCMNNNSAVNVSPTIRAEITYA